MNKEAEERKQRIKKKDEEQTKFFESAQVKNQSIQRKNDIVAEKLLLEKESAIATQKANLINVIDEKWADGVEIRDVPMGKDEVKEFIFVTDMEGSLRKSFVLLLKLMEKDTADFNTLSFGLRMAFKNYQNGDDEVNADQEQ